MCIHIIAGRTIQISSIIIMEEERQKLYGHIAGMSRLMRTLQEEENVARRSKGNNAYRKKAEFMKSRSPSASGFMNETRRGEKSDMEHRPAW